MNDNGILIAPTQADLTPMQRFVYVMARDHHTDDYSASAPSNVREAQRMTRGI